jgi:hypothetical protein
MKTDETLDFCKVSTWVLILRTAADFLEGLETEKSTPTTTGLVPPSAPPPTTAPATKKPGRPKSKPVPAALDEEDEVDVKDEINIQDLINGEPAAVPAEPAKPTVTLEAVIEAFRAFAMKNSRDKAREILKSFGVEAVTKLKPEQFADVLKKLGA